MRGRSRWPRMVVSHAGLIAAERWSRQAEGSRAMHAALRTSRTSRFSWRFAMIVGIAAIALGNGNAGAADLRPSVATPSLVDVSATTQTPRLFTVTGNGFTPG